MAQARVKGLFIGMDGVVRAENLPTNKREIEFIDGAHPFIPAAIYHDIHHKGPPLYIVWQGRPMPEGVKADDRTTEESLIKEATYMGMHNLKPLISRRWTRMLIRSAIILIKSIFIGFVVGFVMLLALVVIG